MWRRTIACLLLVGGGIGCGAKTGPVVPDASGRLPPDATPRPQADAGLPPPTCITAPPESGLVSTTLQVPAALAVVDIVFLIDGTASMRDEIEGVREALRGRVVPGVRAVIPDAAFGLAFFGEFPVRPHGVEDNEPYQLRSPVTTQVTRVEAAFDRFPEWGNLDEAEATIEGLFQVVTGEGYGDPGVPGFIPASSGCPSGGNGGVCFREEALPIVMIVTDAPMNNGPPGVPPESQYEFFPPPHSYEEAVASTRDLGALLVGLGATDLAGAGPLPHLRRLAVDVGAVDASGAPLVFDIGDAGRRIGDEIVDAVQFVASEVPLDIDAIVEDVPGDALDVNEVVVGVRALSAQPPGNVAEISGNTFRAVVPGTSLTFAIDVDSSAVPAVEERRVYRGRVLFRASGRSRLDVRELLIVVPGTSGRGCDTEP